MITKNNLFSFNITVTQSQTYTYTLFACAYMIRFFFLLNICKTIIAQEIYKQRAQTQSPIGGIKEERNIIKKKRGREKEREREATKHDRLATTLVTTDWQKKAKLTEIQRYT